MWCLRCMGVTSLQHCHKKEPKPLYHSYSWESKINSPPTHSPHPTPTLCSHYTGITVNHLYVFTPVRSRNASAKRGGSEQRSNDSKLPPPASHARQNDAQAGQDSKLNFSNRNCFVLFLNHFLYNVSRSLFLSCARSCSRSSLKVKTLQ